MEDAEIAEIAEDAAEGPAPAPTAEGPYLHLHLQPHWSDHTPRTRESQQRTLGDQPVYIVTFHMDTISTWISGYPVQY